jgi:hypothetical protein
MTNTEHYDFLIHITNHVTKITKTPQNCSFFHKQKLKRKVPYIGPSHSLDLETDIDTKTKAVKKRNTDEDIVHNTEEEGY